jgi:Lamin Tail Domain
MKKMILVFMACFCSAFSFAKIQMDSIPPIILSVTITGPNKLDIKFSEPVEQASAEQVLNYTLVENTVHPTYGLRDNANLSIVHLVFTTRFIERINYEISLTGIQDLSANIIHDSTFKFVLYQPMPYDIVIDEIMADPTPSNGLPEVEWIEIRNVSPFEINLSDWKLAKSTGKSGPIANRILKPDSVLIICSTGSLASISAYGSSLSVTSFPTLSNTGDLISLLAPDGRTIHAVNYTDDWYHNELKKQGGWSLEMTDINNPCSGTDNWSASININGATPGFANSIDALNIDDYSPKLIRAIATDSFHVVLYFNEPMDSLSAMNVANYQIDNGIGSPISVLPSAPLFDKIIIETLLPIQENKVYNVTVNGVTDCISNSIGSFNTTRFGIASLPDSFDIVVNEILFNPKSDGVDYIELYNRSEKMIDLKSLHIANLNSLGSIDNIISLPEDGYLFFPKQMLVFTTSSSIVKRNYVSNHPDNIITVNDLPSFNDDEGNVILLNEQGNIIDKLSYKDDWHFKLLNDVEGIALERINYDSKTQDENNWHSASETVGFGTPADKNSQCMNNDIVAGTISVSPKIISPNNDGFDDVAVIYYSFPEPGYVANIIIFDVSGNPVKHLKTNALCGSQGIYYWDGLNDKNQRINTGQYIVYTEVFNVKGTVKRFKNCITVVDAKM